jgi:hypothetical protein
MESNTMLDSELIQKPYDKFWDEPMLRREAQKAFQKLGNNDSELMAMVDTNCLVVNFLCEKLGVTRGELDAYVEKKAAEVKTLQEAKAAAEAADVITNG